MEISIQQKVELANLIEQEIKNEFDKIHLSLNLAETIKIKINGSSVQVEIPAQMYDIKKFRNEGVIVYTGKGSYASSVNNYGGFSRKHKNYVDRCIYIAIEKWLKQYQLQGGAKVYE